MTGKIKNKIIGQEENSIPEYLKPTYELTSYIIKLKQIKIAFAKYVKSEGCSCCQDFKEHEKTKNIIGKLLEFERFTDNSGYDFYIDTE